MDLTRTRVPLTLLVLLVLYDSAIEVERFALVYLPDSEWLNRGAYLRCHTGDGPQFTANKPAADSCPCGTTKRHKEILCVFMAGIETKTIIFCDCRSDVETLLHHHLFPSSPSQPRVGFHLKLLEFYSVLRVKGHVACQAFGNTYASVRNYKDPDQLRKSLANAFFVYREMLAIIQTRLTTKYESLVPKFPCPVCPEDQKTVTLDGNFQLRRRKANDNDMKKPIPREFFLADNVQDKFEWITSKSTASNTNPDEKNLCKSVYKAAELTYTSQNYSKFHERGVVGCLCVHNIPLAFTNIYESGEKYKYALAILDIL
ncbi:hypothetical protein BJV82DRAFT_661695 [Fennellomyces sp. T-0311]|nr:hypothetical protein BJV82DRAFT_661695 [Fennellomyces sp. T-0311]